MNPYESLQFYLIIKLLNKIKKSLYTFISIIIEYNS